MKKGKGTKTKALATTSLVAQSHELRLLIWENVHGSSLPSLFPPPPFIELFLGTRFPLPGLRSVGSSSETIHRSAESHSGPMRVQPYLTCFILGTIFIDIENNLFKCVILKCIKCLFISFIIEYRFL